jgi:acetyltransferase-like isoleucine patch superfamily enzyme
MLVKSFEQAFGETFSVIADRIRANLLSMRGARLGYGTRVGANCRFVRPWCLQGSERVTIEQQVFVKATSDSAKVVLGREVFVGFNTEIDASESVRVGNMVLIAPGCFITDHNHRRVAGQYIANQGCDVAPVVLEDDVWLGAGVVVLPGVTIGAGAVVAAGAVVNRSVEPMAIVAGVPARPIGSRAG